MRKDKATLDEMQAVVGMQLLDAVLILTRSQFNRQRLLALGLLPAVATIMKVMKFNQVHSEGPCEGLLLLCRSLRLSCLCPEHAAYRHPANLDGHLLAKAVGLHVCCFDSPTYMALVA